jgi:hypothetical protein
MFQNTEEVWKYTLKILQIGGWKMDILNGFLEGTDNNFKDTALIILVLVLVFGGGKNTGLNLFNNRGERGKSYHHKHRSNSCSSPGG